MVRRENEEIEKQLNKVITTEQLVEVKENSSNKPITNGQAIFPFIILAAISVIVLLIKPIHEVMNQTIFALSFPQIETGRGFIVEATDSYGAIHIFTHAGFVLLLTVIVTLLLYLQKGYPLPSEASFQFPDR